MIDISPKRDFDASEVANLLDRARELCEWNYRLQMRVNFGSVEQDKWSAVLGHIENGLERLNG